MVQKKMFLPLAGIVSAGAIFLGGSQIFATQSGSTSLAQAIAQKFNLDQSQVQSVINQFRSNQQSNRQQQAQQREGQYLDQLVSQGKITAAQKQAILDEQAKLHSEYNPQNLKNQTPQQRQQTMQNEQNELKSWAQSQGIDLSLLKPSLGMGPWKGAGIHRGRGKQAPSITPTPAT